MMRGKIRFCVVLLAICLVINLVGCTKTPEPIDSADNMDSIIRYPIDWPCYYDPAIGTNGASTAAIVNFYDPLVFPTIDGHVKPHVASDWTVSDDDLTYTFKIRQDIKFHSGNLLKASDVAFSMNRFLTIGEGFSYLYSDVVKDCYAADDETVVMELNHASGPFITTLVRCFILEEDLVTQNCDKSVDTYGEYGDYGKKWLLIHDAGSGPYKTKEFRLEEFVLGEQFEDYFGGWEKDAPQYMMINNMTDAVAQRTAFANKEIEIVSDILPQETYDEIGKMGGNVIRIYGAGIWSMFLNTKIAPTDCEYFRKALAYAFDYATLTKSIFRDYSLATGPVPNEVFGKNHDLPGYNFDLDKAREMLAQSKYADQPDKWFVSLAWCAEVPEQEKISLMFQVSLKELGIELEITKTPFSVMTAKAQTIETTPNASIVLWGPSYFEAGAVFKTRYHSDSTGSWEQMEWVLDEELDKMIDDSLKMVDDKERERMYQEIEAYIFDLCPTIWMCASDAQYACQSYVEWPMATYYAQGKKVMLPGGYSLYFHDCKVFLDKR